MSDLHWLSKAQVDRLQPSFPRSFGKPRVDDRRVLSGLIYIQRNGLMWKHAPQNYGPPKTHCNATIMTALAAQAQDTEMVMIDATHLKTHRAASGLTVKKGGADG
jgi:transposase